MNDTIAFFLRAMEKNWIHTREAEDTRAIICIWAIIALVSSASLANGTLLTHYAPLEEFETSPQADDERGAERQQHPAH
jgi:hypothetical protein